MRRLLTILNDDDAKRLRRPAKRVKNVQATEVILAIQEMKRVAYEWEQQTGRRCEGLAANQIGIPLRIIILRKSDDMKPRDPSTMQDSWLDADGNFDVCGYADAVSEYKEWNRVNGSTFDPWQVLINVTIQQEEGTQDSIEGCLSVPGSTYMVIRPTHVAFTCMYPNGKSSGVHLARGENAIKLLHEVDHDRGVLLPDIASAAFPGEHPKEPL